MVAFAGQQDGEFVAGQARDEMAREHIAHPVRDDLEKEVAGRMAVGVVDLLELVEVNENDGDAVGLHMGQPQGFRQLGVEHGAVGKSGQCIVVGQELDRLAGLEPVPEPQPDKECRKPRRHEQHRHHDRDAEMDQVGQEGARRLLVVGQDKRCHEPSVGTDGNGNQRGSFGAAKNRERRGDVHRRGVGLAQFAQKGSNAWLCTPQKVDILGP